MKILFICGSLEPGQDGVGDYTRRLAAELIKQGHTGTIVSLNDKQSKEESEGLQHYEGIKLKVLRLPSSLSISNRIELVKDWIDKFNPDWLSLQYVPFSFHEKGLPFRLGSFLSSIGQGRKWHIMFHELWVGMEVQAGFKQIFWGNIQRKLIRLLINRLHPSVVHTQTAIYREQLKRLGTEAYLLPLYGNISPYKNRETNMHRNPLNKKELSFVLFGTIYPGAPVLQFTREASAYSRKKNCSVKLIIVGRSGSEQKTWVDSWHSEGLEVEVLGEQASAVISSVLQKASFGITTTPMALVEKSGTAAAMKEHHLPVICVSHPWKVRGFSFISEIPGVIEYQPGNFDLCLSFEPAISYNVKAANIAKSFIEQLTNCTSKNSIVKLKPIEC